MMCGPISYLGQGEYQPLPFTELQSFRAMGGVTFDWEVQTLRELSMRYLSGWAEGRHAVSVSPVETLIDAGEYDPELGFLEFE